MKGGGRVGTAFEETGSSLQAWEWGPGGLSSPCGAGTQDCLGLTWRRRLSQGSFPVREHPASRVEGCLGIFFGGAWGTDLKMTRLQKVTSWRSEGKGGEEGRRRPALDAAALPMGSPRAAA